MTPAMQAEVERDVRRDFDGPVELATTLSRSAGRPWHCESRDGNRRRKEAALTGRALRYHFSGIGGAGMNPLAQLMRARGHVVQGSDRSFDQGKNREVAERLLAVGVVLIPQDGSAITADLDRFVYSTAVEAETPEFRAARAMGIERVPRPALLAEVVDVGRPGVAIAGTSGKSTVTGMVAWIAREAGMAAAALRGAAVGCG